MMGMTLGQLSPEAVKQLKAAVDLIECNLCNDWHLPGPCGAGKLQRFKKSPFGPEEKDR